MSEPNVKEELVSIIRQLDDKQAQALLDMLRSMDFNAPLPPSEPELPRVSKTDELEAFIDSIDADGIEVANDWIRKLKLDDN